MMKILENAMVLKSKGNIFIDDDQPVKSMNEEYVNVLKEMGLDVNAEWITFTVISRGMPCPAGKEPCTMDPVHITVGWVHHQSRRTSGVPSVFRTLNLSLFIYFGNGRSEEFSAHSSHGDSLR
jgi:hypothetical protein